METPDQQARLASVRAQHELERILGDDPRLPDVLDAVSRLLTDLAQAMRNEARRGNA